MEEDTSIIGNQLGFNTGDQTEGSVRSTRDSFEKIDHWSQCDNFDDIIEYENGTASNQNKAANIVIDICSKCVQLEVELQKSKMVVAKLQKRCIDKTAEIKRLRCAEKRSKIARSSLEDIIREIKKKNWISVEGENVLNVNNLR